MDLLSQSQRDAIQDALNNVFDTFHKTPVTITRVSAYADDWMEDMPTKSGDTTTVNGLVTYPDKNKSIEENMEGAYDDNTVRVEISIQNLTALGLTNSEGLPMIAPERDSMVINGQPFLITFVGIEGAINKINYLAILHGRHAVKTT